MSDLQTSMLSRLSHCELICACRCVSTPTCYKQKMQTEVTIPKTVAVSHTAPKAPTDQTAQTAHTQPQRLKTESRPLFCDNTFGQEPHTQEDENKVHFRGNIWREGHVSRPEPASPTPIPNSESSESKRRLGFYPQLGVFTACTLAIGYWWMMSPFTEGYR